MEVLLEYEEIFALLLYVIIFTYGFWKANGDRQLRWWAWSMMFSLITSMHTFIGIGLYVAGWFIVELLYLQFRSTTVEEE